MDQAQDKSQGILTKGSSRPKENLGSDLLFMNIVKAQIDLCELLVGTSTQFDPQTWVTAATTYLKKFHRFRYADISNYVFGICSDEAREATFTTNLESVQQYIQDEYAQAPFDRRNEFWTVMKFYDHAHLALHQSRLVTDAQNS